MNSSESTCGRLRAVGIGSGSRRRVLLALMLVLLCFVKTAAAQVDPPDRKFLFFEDRTHPKYRPRPPAELTVQEAEASNVTLGDTRVPFDIDAPSLRFDAAENRIFAEGGMTITHSGSVFEAESGSVALDTGEAFLDNNVFVSDQLTSITAQEAMMNIESGKGSLNHCSIDYAGGMYHFKAAQVGKSGEDEYDLTDATATTCDCADSEDCNPWELRSDRVEITKEGYGKAWDSTLRFYDVPVFYLPWIVFPARTQRHTGFLPFTFGTGSESGFRLETPFFWAIDESSDLLLTPLVDTGTRFGTKAHYRNVFSRKSNLVAGGAYYNEQWRDGDPQGTDTVGLFDPTIGEDRTAGYLDYRYRSNVGDLPVQLIVDGNYVSDDLILREMPMDEIAERNSRYVNSSALFRTFFWDTYSADLRAEYSQALVTDDDLVFQRLPDLTIGGGHRFEPFGVNQYGSKFILSNELTAVNFSRVEGYDGWRYEYMPEVRMPFRFKNFFSSEASASVRGTLYELDNNYLPDDGNEETDPVALNKSTDRLVPEFNYRIGSVVEKTFDVSSDSLAARIAELGGLGITKKLVRMKHTVNPRIKYKYVPYVDQTDNPQFDSLDKLAERNVMTFEINQSLFGRYDDRSPHLYGIEEAAPEIDDLGVMSDRTPIEPTLGYDGAFSGGDGAAGLPPRPTIRELAQLRLAQSLDINEARKDEDPDRSEWSDLKAELLLLPNEYFRLRGGMDFGIEDQNFSAYYVGGQFFDKRGDQLRALLTFNDQNVRQLEASLQMNMTQRLKLGYYTRYDDLNSEFIENRVGMRVLSACRCWLFDVEFSDLSNPDESRVNFAVTLVGLGEFGSNVYSTGSDNS
ncbi:MAG: LPS-assembly protein LptD [Bdellovibrionales bacterium]|nr:LPS-assembly protein LptD [Bdellovibrionales bacterium]